MFGTLFGFKGRLSRAGFIEALLSIVLIDVGVFLFSRYVGDYGMPGGDPTHGVLTGDLPKWLPIAFAVLTVWSLLAVMVKRCHDRSRPGWLLLIAVVPVIGWLWLLVDLFILGGTKGRNRYGRQPHSHEPEPWSGVWAPDPEPATADAAAADPHHGEAGLDWTGQGVASGHDHGGHDHGDHGHGGHDDHGHDAHGHEDHGHDDHVHAAHDAHAHDDHGHGDDHDHGHAAHDSHGHDDHGHGAHAEASHGDDHGHGDHGHDDHGHDDRGHDDHGHDDHGHADRGHDDHGHGHGAHADAHEEHHAHA